MKPPRFVLVDYYVNSKHNGWNFPGNLGSNKVSGGSLPVKLFFFPLIFVSFLSAQDNGRDVLNQGIRDFKQGKYVEAVAAFERATNLAPNDVTPHLYLGMTYLALLAPGADTPENLVRSANAEREFQRVLALEPTHKLALQSLASLSYNQKKLDEAKTLYERILTLDANDKEAYYTLGVIAWSKAYSVRMEARKKVGMKPETPGPLPPSVRFDVANMNWALVNDGIAKLEKAIEIDPQYDDAMAYLNLMHREKADIQESADAYRAEIKLADELVAKTLAIKKAKGLSGSGMMSVAPPPPPPPGPTGRIQVGGNVQQANLIEQARPAYPPLAKQARIQGMVRFNTVIGLDGKIIWLQVVSGHPLLIPAAQDAVKQWVYRPTLLNGNPVEVQTAVDVNFTLSQ